ncbi:hypothetical protein SmJEL517_g00834 [Synchytrium microbalum]|uniref:Protein RER1 n=1 Tax=Synchytrium microbalum TaxID=1806994 RepID=A0A507CCY7_9FUNG|nr:uncharacterized protein SmJEL517_g00834 [Synchytrium microbalum]TPX37208.1 hypothetical protein SmJEL517_g00834 [Synchytrium microbalum]
MNGAGANGGISGDTTPASKITQQTAHYARLFQKFLDDSTPYYTYRWGFTAFVSLIYFIRVFSIQGWYIVTYALGIYLLNLFLAFLQPKFDPAMDSSPLDGDDDDSKEQGGLPTKMDDEFRPFIRRLPEFKFCVYFFILFGITMRRQIKHMIKYRYIPFNLGKKTYAGPGGGPANQKNNK